MARSQTLQLYFDLDNPATGANNGFFAPDSAGHRSEVWVDDTGNHSQNVHVTLKFNDKTDVSVTTTVNLPVGWRFTDLNGQCLRITALIGRVHASANAASYDSPFTLGNVATNPSCTVFDAWIDAAGVNTGGGVINLVIGKPFLASGNGHSGNKDKYEFTVAVTVFVLDNSGTFQAFTAELDPQMDVNC